MTLKKCFSEIEAHQLKNILDNEEIFNQVVNGTISQVYNFHTPADGGILIKVHQKDQMRAISVLESKLRQDILSENLWNKSDISEDTAVPKNKGKAKILYLVILILALLAIMATIASQF